MVQCTIFWERLTTLNSFDHWRRDVCAGNRSDWRRTRWISDVQKTAEPAFFRKCTTGSSSIGLKGFESWCFLARRFAVPNLSLLTWKRYLSLGSEQTTEWERLDTDWGHLSNRQTGPELPDSILVATLLNKTNGQLQQHLRLNAWTL